MNATRPSPTPLSDFTAKPRLLFIAAIAMVVGTGGFLAGVVLLHLIWLFTNIAYFGEFSLLDRSPSDTPFGLWIVLIPVIGGLIIGLMARYGSEKIRGHGIPEAMEAILLGRSRLDAKVAALKPLSSAISIGSGCPFGAEGPIIMTGGAVGSLIAQALPVSDSERKTLLVAGAVAGMTTVFGSPIAAIMLAVELLLFEWRPRSFIPVVVAAVIASVERTLVGMPAPLFPFEASIEISFDGLMIWVVVGLCCGCLSGGLTRMVYASEDLFQKLPIHWMWWPMIGGAIVGIGGLIEPHALGVGYENIARMINGEMLAGAALVLLVVKAVIWALALGSGTSGGVLAPLLILGGALGATLAGLFPSVNPGFLTLLAMAATMGGTMRAPLTATFFAIELTGNMELLVPVVTACAAAYTLTVLLMRRSILTEKLARRGHHIVREYRVDPFALTQVKDIMTTDVESVPASMSLHGAAAFLTAPDCHHPSYPVVDHEGRVLGVMDPPAILGWRREGRNRHASLAELLAGQDIVTANPNEYLETVVDAMMRHNIAHIPVVSQDGMMRLVGYLSWRDLMRVRRRIEAEENERTAFYARRLSDRLKQMARRNRTGGPPQGD